MKTLSVPAIILGAFTLTACASDGQPNAVAPLLPTSQYSLEAQAREDAPVHLRFSADRLSTNQMTALDKLSARSDSTDIIITTGPRPTSESYGRLVSDYLVSQGVDPRSVSYRTVVEHPADIVSLTLVSYRARNLDCNRSWENLSRTASNTPHSNFGCAVTANMAAQIADPRDIAAPTATTPADAGRKTTVIDKYRKGEVTSSADNAAATSAISDAVK
ncbi:CpaD family pilus assembly lipoprotein [Asticcacaulis endophyticus]|uniref:Pilus assembly protein CpaD n=1 Tax=Asticcacaulis endophyticus TaxID=1395890 RepID=A0A918UMJ3_9CAUL|nr:CpaD family pilus assembly lipoprotein [Asticcacaulis endophyticus]GGZ20658.1 pilus assembly protein CpaD [Asticcacaulis endophyticus]